MTGGWSAYTDDPTEIPDEALDALNAALEELVGCVYKPIALLATQVVAGTNYCFLCETTVVAPDAQPSYALVYVFDGLSGEHEILRVQEIESVSYTHLDVYKRQLVVRLAAADLGKEVRAAPAEQRDDRKPEPHSCLYPLVLNFIKGNALEIDQPGLDHLLQAHQDAELGVHPRQAALEIDGVGRANRAVSGKLNGGTLHERARRHDDLKMCIRDRPG